MALAKALRDNGGMYFRRAFTETTSFWTIHRNWAYAAGPISGLLLRGISQGWHTLTDIRAVLVFSVGGFVVAWLGTFVINVVRSPYLISRERGEQIEELKKDHDRSQVLVKIKEGKFKTTVEHVGHDFGNEPVYQRTVCISLLVSFTNVGEKTITLESCDLILNMADGRALTSPYDFVGDPLDVRTLGRQTREFPAVKMLERDTILVGRISETREIKFYQDVETGRDDNFYKTAEFIVTVTDSLGAKHFGRHEAGAWPHRSSSSGEFVRG